MMEFIMDATQQQMPHQLYGGTGSNNVQSSSSSLQQQQKQKQMLSLASNKQNSTIIKCKDVQSIIETFTEVLKHPERCSDFDLLNWLKRYETLRGCTNFTEAAIIIMNAGQIYGRKVNYLASLVLNMERDQQLDEANKTDNTTPSNATNTKMRRKKILAGGEEYLDIDFSKPVTIKTTTIEALTEPWNFSSDDEEDDVDRESSSPPKKSSDPFDRYLKKYSAKKVSYPRLNAMRANEGGDSNFGKIPIHDRDGYIDSRSNYAVFMNCIDPIDNTILDRLDYVPRRHQLNSSSSSTESPQRRPFPMYMSATYLKDNYDIELNEMAMDDFENMKRYQRQIKNVLAMDMNDLYSYENGAELNRILNGHEECATKTGHKIDDEDDLNYTDEGFGQDDEMSSDNLNNSSATTINNDSFNCSSINSSSIDPVANSTQVNSSGNTTIVDDIGTPNTTLNDSSLTIEAIAKLDTLLASPKRGSGAIDDDQSAPISNRVSLDEGIDSPTVCLSEMDPFERSTYMPVVELFDICSSMNLAEGEKTEIAIQVTPEFEQTFCSPAARITAVCTFTSFKALNVSTALSVNCFRFPLQMLRKRLMFSLPPEYACPKFAKRKNVSDSSGSSKAIKFNDLETCSSIGNDDYLLGFDDDHNAHTMRLDGGSPYVSDDDEMVDDAEPLTNDTTALESESTSETAPLASAEEPKTSETDNGATSISEASSIFHDSGLGDSEQSLCESGSDQTLPQQNTERSLDDRLNLSNEIEQQTVVAEAATDETSEQINKELSEKRAAKMSQLKEMTERVSNWHESLRPAILRSQQRNHFDIHEFGRKIVTTVHQGATAEQPVTFGDIINSETDKSHTANYFLSMLQLINNRAIDITVDRRPNTFEATQYSSIKISLCSDSKEQHGESKS